MRNCKASGVPGWRWSDLQSEWVAGLESGLENCKASGLPGWKWSELQSEWVAGLPSRTGPNGIVQQEPVRDRRAKSLRRNRARE